MNIIDDTFAWLSDPSRWSGDGSIPQRLLEHVGVTLLVILIAGLLAIPAGIAIGHTRRGKAFVISFAGAMRAIPSLGLLTLVGIWVGIGLEAPIVTLVVL